jgi:hypothetical protein
MAPPHHPFAVGPCDLFLIKSQFCGIDFWGLLGDGFIHAGRATAVYAGLIMLSSLSGSREPAGPLDLGGFMVDGPWSEGP